MALEGTMRTTFHSSDQVARHWLATCALLDGVLALPWHGQAVVVLAACVAVMRSRT